MSAVDREKRYRKRLLVQVAGEIAAAMIRVYPTEPLHTVADRSFDLAKQILERVERA